MSPGSVMGWMGRAGHIGEVRGLAVHPQGCGFSHDLTQEILLNGIPCFVTGLTPLISLLPGESPDQAIAEHGLVHRPEESVSAFGNIQERRDTFPSLELVNLQAITVAALTTSSTIFPRRQLPVVLKSPIGGPSLPGFEP